MSALSLHIANQGDLLKATLESTVQNNAGTQVAPSSEPAKQHCHLIP